LSNRAERAIVKAMVSARFLVPLAAVVCAAVVPVASARVQPAARITATCTAAEQAANQAALAAYVKRMARDRKAYFKKHRYKAHRKAFVKRQQTRLKALQTAAACQVVTPPPPPPPFQSGHYAGKTSQNENFAFDVSADGSTLMNLTTGQINESCNDFNLYGGNLHATGNVASISADGNFTIHSDDSGKFSDGTPYEDHLTITGRLSGSSATGTLLDTTSFTLSGTQESCTSNQQTWSASKTG
jgi:hypothetical protein